MTLSLSIITIRSFHDFLYYWCFSIRISSCRHQSWLQQNTHSRHHRNQWKWCAGLRKNQRLSSRHTFCGVRPASYVHLPRASFKHINSPRGGVNPVRKVSASSLKPGSKWTYKLVRCITPFTFEDGNWALRLSGKEAIPPSNEAMPPSHGFVSGTSRQQR